MGTSAFVNAWRDLELTAEFPVFFGVISLVGEDGPDTGHDGEGTKKQTLEQHGIVDIGRRGEAGGGDAIPPRGDVVFGARLLRAKPRDFTRNTGFFRGGATYKPLESCDLFADGHLGVSVPESNQTIILRNFFNILNVCFT